MLLLPHVKSHVGKLVHPLHFAELYPIWDNAFIQYEISAHRENTIS